MIGYKIRLIHNQIHKRMEAKKQENEKEPLTGMQRWTLGFCGIMMERISIRRILKRNFRYRGQPHQTCLQSWNGKGWCAVRRWSMMRG